MSHPIKELLSIEGYKLTDSGEYWKTTAHYRGGKNPTSLSIHKRTGCFNDFSAGYKGSPEKLIRLVKGELNEEDLLKILSYVPTEVTQTFKIEKIYPKEILQRLLPDYQLFLDRGISEKTLIEFEAGLAHAGKLNRRICFPIYNRKGQIHGFSGRWHTDDVPSFDDRKLPKWKHLGSSLSFVYPCHLNDSFLREKRKVIIVESIGDVLALWDAGVKEVVCSFGTNLSTKLINYIIGIDPTQIIIATNNDLAVENTKEQERKGPAAAKRMKKKLEKFFSSEKLFILLPTKKDFGVMSKNEIVSWYGNGSCII